VGDGVHPKSPALPGSYKDRPFLLSSVHRRHSNPDTLFAPRGNAITTVMETQQPTVSEPIRVTMTLESQPAAVTKPLRLRGGSAECPCVGKLEGHFGPYEDSNITATECLSCYACLILCPLNYSLGLGWTVLSVLTVGCASGKNVHWSCCPCECRQDMA